MERLGLVVATALAPVSFGTTYVVVTELLPDGRPLFSAAVRALPIGILMAAVGRRSLRSVGVWPTTTLGLINFGAFFTFLFVAAYRLPGGLVATIIAIQPLMVAALARWLLGDPLTRRNAIAALVGLCGVALLVLDAGIELDPVGVAAAFGAAGAVAAGIVLQKRWIGSPESLMAFTGWQLIIGGAVVAVVALVVEGAPPAIDAEAAAGYAYLALVATAGARLLWFRGVGRLPAMGVSLLALLGPIVAATLGWVVLDQALSAMQMLGIALVFAGVVAGQHERTREPVTTG